MNKLVEKLHPESGRHTGSIQTDHVKAGQEVLFRCRWTTQIVTGTVIVCNTYNTRFLIEYVTRRDSGALYTERKWHRPRHIKGVYST